MTGAGGSFIFEVTIQGPQRHILYGKSPVDIWITLCCYNDVACEVSLEFDMDPVYQVNQQFQSDQGCSSSIPIMVSYFRMTSCHEQLCARGGLWANLWHSTEC